MTSTLEQRSPLSLRLAAFGGFLLLCAVFPLTILHYGSQNLLLLNARMERQESVRRLNRRLQQLDVWRDSSAFINRLCEIMFQTWQRTGCSDAGRAAVYRRLQRWYGNSIHLALFHTPNRPVFVDPNLPGTARQWAMMGELLAFAQRHQYDINLKKFDAKAQQVAEYLLGPLVYLRYLRESLNPGIYLSHTAVFPSLRSVWFRMPGIGPGFAAVIDTSFFRRGNHWPIALRFLNRRLPSEIRIGWSSFWRTGKVDTFSLPSETLHRHELTAAVTRFRQTQEAEIETPHYLVVCRAMPQYGILFAFQPRSRIHERSETSRTVWNFMIVGLLVAAGVWGFRAFVQQRMQFISIRLQISAAFLFATGLPFVGIGFLAHEYLQHRESDLRNQVYVRSEQFLRQIDSRFSSCLLAYQTGFSALTASLSASLPVTSPAAQASALAAGITELDTGEFYMVSSDEKPIHTQGSLLSPGVRPANSVDKEQRLFSAVLAALFRDLTGITADPRKNLALNELIEDFMGRENTEEFRNTMILQMGRITQFLNMDKRIMVMLSPVTDGVLGPLRYLCLAQWSQWRMQIRHILVSEKQLRTDRHAPRLFAYTTTVEELQPPRTPDPMPLRQFSLRVVQQKRSMMETIGWNGRSWLAVGIPGQQLSNHILVALTPVSIIERRLLSLKRLLLAVAFFALAASIAIAAVLSRSILMPIQRLSEATQAIEHRRFDFRVSGLSGDEFGELGQVFNRALEGFGELQTAGEVQVNLFPMRLTETPEMEAAVLVLPGRRLGGAFSELASLPQQRLLLTMGSVGQTGVRGALTLAMLKSLLHRRLGEYSLVQEESDRLRTHLGELLLGNRSLSPSFASLTIDGRNGTLAVDTDGYPLYYAIIPGTFDDFRQALGSLKLLAEPASLSRLAPGETLILASSAFVEAWREIERLGLSVLSGENGSPSSSGLSAWRAVLERQIKSSPVELSESGEAAIAIVSRRQVS